MRAPWSKRQTPTGLRAMIPNARVVTERARSVLTKPTIKKWAPVAGIVSAVTAIAGVVLRPRVRAAISHQSKRIVGKTRGAVGRVVRQRESIEDPVLVDRVRAALAPVERELDIPRVHVMVTNGFAVLHGSLPTQAARHQIEEAVARVDGIRGIENHLQVGPMNADTRPSEGRRRARSIRMGRLRVREGAAEERTGAGTAP